MLINMFVYPFYHTKMLNITKKSDPYFSSHHLGWTSKPSVKICHIKVLVRPLGAEIIENITKNIYTIPMQVYVTFYIKIIINSYVLSAT